MNAATLQQGRTLLSSLGFTPEEITRLQTQRAALPRPAVKTVATVSPAAPPKPEWVRTRPALKLDPLRERIAALKKSHFTHREVGEVDVHTVNILVVEGELQRIRVGCGGRGQSIHVSPLFKRTRKFWDRYRLISGGPRAEDRAMSAARSTQPTDTRCDQGLVAVQSKP